MLSRTMQTENKKSISNIQKINKKKLEHRRTAAHKTKKTAFVQQLIQWQKKRNRQWEFGFQD